MRSRTGVLISTFSLILMVPLTAMSQMTAADTGAPPIDPKIIENAIGGKPVVAPDGVVRVSWARTEISVTVDNLRLLPPAGLTAWAAFAPTPNGAMLMGDTVLLEDEVDAAMDAAFAHDLEVTGLHNHFMFDQPHVYFMHIGGMADTQRLAVGVRAVWEAIRGVRRERSEPAANFGGRPPTPGTFDTPTLEKLIGHPTTIQDGIVKMTIGRDGMMHGVKVGGSMGLTTWMALSGSDSLAAADGDVIMTAGEVQTVLRQLRKSGFHVVALHNHMIGEEPAFYFTHFWATGPAARLAGGFRQVLDAQAEASSGPHH